MKVKTNIRAGQGGSSATDASTSSQTQTQTGKVGGGKPVPVVYYPPVGRCVGI
jgi:hypothetical protein